MREITLKELLEAGCHFGHKTNRWNPKAASFIYKAIGDTHIIDLAKTKTDLEKAAEFVKKTALQGKKVLFLGTKRQAKTIIKEEAEKAGAPYLCERWIGGFITNWDQVSKNIEKLKNIRKRLADKEEMAKYTKKEKVLMQREEKTLATVYGGVIDLTKTPDALFIVDLRKEALAAKEAKVKGIPVVAIVDTNSDPDLADYAVPANDDAVGSVKIITSFMAEAYKEGKTENSKEQERKEKISK